MDEPLSLLTPALTCVRYLGPFVHVRYGIYVFYLYFRYS